MVSEPLPSIEINAVDKEEADLSSRPHLGEMAVNNTGDWPPIQMGSHYCESKLIDTYCNNVILNCMICIVDAIDLFS